MMTSFPKNKKWTRKSEIYPPLCPKYFSGNNGRSKKSSIFKEIQDSDFFPSLLTKTKDLTKKRKVINSCSLPTWRRNPRRLLIHARIRISGCRMLNFKYFKCSRRKINFKKCIAQVPRLFQASIQE